MFFYDLLSIISEGFWFYLILPELTDLFLYYSIGLLSFYCSFNVLIATLSFYHERNLALVASFLAI